MVRRWRSKSQKRSGSWMPRIVVLRSSSKEKKIEESGDGTQSNDGEGMEKEQATKARSRARSRSRAPLRKISSITLGSEGSFIRERLQSFRRGSRRPKKQSSRWDDNTSNDAEGRRKPSRWKSSTESSSSGSSHNNKSTTTPPSPPSRPYGRKEGVVMTAKEKAICSEGITPEMIAKLNASGFYISDTP